MNPELLGKIHQGDCIEFMRSLPDKCIDLIVTDPPYGIGFDKKPSGGFGTGGNVGNYDGDWDNVTPQKETFDEILRISKNAIIFGGQFFTDKLASNGHWIVWDKKGNIEFDNPFGDCELAWTNISKKSVKKYTVIQQGFVSKERVRFHPTQKPVELMANIIKDYSEDTMTIFDPFSGSGSTLVAAKQLGRKFLGCELSERYVKICEERLRQEYLF